jgi:hypothetical protein
MDKGSEGFINLSLTVPNVPLSTATSLPAVQC